MNESQLNTRLAAELDEIAAAGLTRRRRMLESPCGRIVAVDGKKQPIFQGFGQRGMKHRGATRGILAIGQPAQQRQQVEHGHA